MNEQARILIVEDDNVSRDLMSALLKREYQVATARTAEEAESLLPGFRPDLVLLDIVMPGMDGLEFCRRLRARPEYAATRIIMVTGKADPGDRIEGYEAGADNYLVKPIRMPELNAVVRSSLRIRRAEAPTIEKSRNTSVNCWEFMHCARERRRNCPAYTKRLGTMCWLVAGTMCGGRVQGAFAQKYRDCAACHFFQHVSRQSDATLRDCPEEVGSGA